MPKTTSSQGVLRIIDANTNRAKEGLRVCEEVCRFIIDNRSLTRRCKNLRHDLDGAMRKLSGPVPLLKQRDSVDDAGRSLHHEKELKRKSLEDIYRANIQRTKESLRVLEEFSKLKRASLALTFKSMRYDVYELEKKITERLHALRRFR